MEILRPPPHRSSYYNNKYYRTQSCSIVRELSTFVRTAVYVVDHNNTDVPFRPSVVLRGFLYTHTYLRLKR